MAVKNTPFTLTDAEGKALCHTPSQTTKQMNARQRRDAAALFEAMVREAGLVSANGRWTCAVTGRTGYRHTDERAQQVYAGERREGTVNGFVDAGHVIPEEDDGPRCACNLLPQLRQSNLDHEKNKNAPIDSSALRVDDPRVWLRTVFERHGAPRKVAKLV